MFGRKSMWALAVVFFGSAAGAADLSGSSVEDAFIAGQLTAVIEREMRWEADSYTLTVKDGTAYVALRGEGDRKPLPPVSGLGIKGLTDLRLVTDSSAARMAEFSTPRRKAYSFLGLTEHTESFPVNDIFEPLIADLKQPRFFASMREYDLLDSGEVTTSVTVGAVGFGETFGLYRRSGDTPGNGLQLSVSAAVFAQYNLDAESSDLINADYIVGLPLTYRHNRHSARLRLYHQSSHLGDEFLLNVQPERINLSFESLELLYSYDWESWRAYIGGEHILSIEPAGIDKNMLHGGLEYRSGATGNKRGQWIVGVDTTGAEYHDWSVNWSLKAGYEFDAASEGQRLRVLLEAYDGFTPHGQFYNTETEFYGLGLYFGY